MAGRRKSLLRKLTSLPIEVGERIGLKIDITELDNAGSGCTNQPAVLPLDTSITDRAFGIVPDREFRAHSPPAADIRKPPLRARSRLMHGNKQNRYSITSSARADSGGGTSMPSVFAVLRLITNSNLVTCTTGRSAGLSPLRTRPA